MRLTKRDAEQLLATYDADPEGALVVALRAALEQPGLGFDALVALAGFPAERAGALLARQLGALDDLARELNEQRGIRPPAARAGPTKPA